MIAPYWDRLDYIAAVSNGLLWVETVEQMMGLVVPPRAHYLRTILTELNRIASHLLWLATHALDIGAVTVLLWALREREEILKIFERQFGARLTCHAWRIGGMPNDAYDDFASDVRRFVSNFPKLTNTKPCFMNRICESNRWHGVISEKTLCHRTSGRHCAVRGAWTYASAALCGLCRHDLSALARTRHL